MSIKGKKAGDYFRSGGHYLDICCNVLLSLKCILNPIEIIISIVVVIFIVVAMWSSVWNLFLTTIEIIISIVVVISIVVATVLYIKQPRFDQERIRRDMQSAGTISRLEVLNFSYENVYKVHAVNFYKRGFEMSEPHREWITTVAVTLQRSDGVVEVSRKYQNKNKNKNRRRLRYRS